MTTDNEPLLAQHFHEPTAAKTVTTFCIEDEAIVFAASQLEALNLAVAKKTTTAGDCDPETMVVALSDIEHLLED